MIVKKPKLRVIEFVYETRVFYQLEELTLITWYRKRGQYRELVTRLSEGKIRQSFWKRHFNPSLPKDLEQAVNERVMSVIRQHESNSKKREL